MATANIDRHVSIVLGDGTVVDASHPIPIAGGSSGSVATTLAAGAVSAGAFVAGALVDGADVSVGATTDTAVIGDVSGTVQAKLRGINKILAGTGSNAQDIQGAAATGATASGNPVQVGGVDGSGKAQPIDIVSFVDVNATLSPGPVTFQRLSADIMVQDPSGNFTNRVRSAAAMIGGALGGALVGTGVGLYNSGAGKFIAAIGNSDGSLPVGGYTGHSDVTLTRPANTSTYSANTAVANATSGAVAITFTNCARLTGGSGFIIGADILDEANQTLKGAFELWLYNQAPSTVINDNANWAPTDADRANRVGVVKFDSGTVGNNASGASGNCEFYDQLTHPIPYVCVGGTSLYGQLVVRNAYVPVSAEVFQITLRLSQD